MISFRWVDRLEPLEPRALLAFDEVARRLRRKLLRSDSFDRLLGVGDERVLILLGSELPWVDGVLYFGRDARAPSLLLPTALAPELPVEVLEAAVLARSLSAPILVCPSPALTVSVAAARPLSRSKLEAPS
ncbi:MAG: hypothetical protein HY791_27360 [Deltaproteobacteria bacterium]|nr:hypothetical protein [Deltaproteobacteria bacterium]